MINNPTSRIIAISGVSRAGKTSAAIQIQQAMHHVPVRIFHLDNFVFPEAQIPKIQNHTDWECPASTNFDALVEQLQPHMNRPGISIIEGLFPFSDARLIPLYSKVIYLSLPFKEFYRRKISDQRWGQEPSWYIRHIWISHLRHGLPPETLTNKALYINDYNNEHNASLINFITR